MRRCTAAQSARSAAASLRAQLDIKVTHPPAAVVSVQLAVRPRKRQQLAKCSKGTGPYANQMSWELDVRIGPTVHKEASAASLSSSKNSFGSVYQPLA